MNTFCGVRGEGRSSWGFGRSLTGSAAGLSIRWGEMAQRAVTNITTTVFGTSEFDALTDGSILTVTPRAAIAVEAEREARRVALRKRLFETAVAVLLLLLVLPALILISLAVLVTSGRPIFFRQPRVGKDGKRFTMLKFRTFPVDHIDDVQSRPLSDCPSGLGRLLRRSSLDELPQLLNVVKGEMALVGPRPERPHFAEALAEEVPGYHERHRVPGGITGLAQVAGYWGESDLSERVRLDNEYIDDWSFRRDLGILARTIPAVIRKARS